MSQDIVPFDYAAFGIAPDKASRLEFYASRIEAGHQSAMVAMMQTAEAVAKAREEFQANQDFGLWRQQRLSWLSNDMGSHYINLWNQYGEEFVSDTCRKRLFQVSPSLLRIMAQPAADGIREDVEARIEAGEKVPVAEIERLKREHKAKLEQAAKEAEEARSCEAIARKQADIAKAEARRIEQEIRAVQGHPSPRGERRLFRCTLGAFKQTSSKFHRVNVALSRPRSRSAYETGLALVVFRPCFLSQLWRLACVVW